MAGSRIWGLAGKISAIAIILLVGMCMAQQVSPCKCPIGKLEKNESALMLAAQTQSGSCRNEALVGLFSIYLSNQQKEGAKAVLNSLERVVFQPCEDSLVAEYTWLRGRYFYLMNNPDSSIACLTRAADLAAAIGHHFLEVKCLGDIARSYTMSNLFDQSLEYYRKCLLLSEKHHFIVHLDNLYGNLATTYGFIFSAGGGEIYLDSVEWAEHISIRYAAQTKDTNALVFAYSNLANVHLNRGNTALAFLYCDSILNIVPFGTGPYLAALSTKSEAYHQREDLQNAIRYADSALVVAQLVGAPLEKVIAMEILSAFLAEAGRFEEALTLHKQLKTLEDSINNVERTRVIGDLEQSFNKERNEQTIASLTKDAEIQDLNIRILAGIVLVAILILVIAAILYRQQTLRTRQKMMETELRLNRARMDPHFFFNMLTALQGLALDPERAAKVPIYLAQYSRLMRRTLESTYLEMVSIADEADFLNAYLELQSVRFPGKFTWEIDIDPELDPEAVKVPAMLIQPFAENAVEHGFKTMPGGGKLTISFKKSADALVISLKDNGNGGTGSEKSHTSRATQIVQDRLYLINQQSKSACTFHAGPNANSPGYAVSIHLPLNLA